MNIPDPASVKSNFKDLTYLVVDDFETMCEITASQLRRLGVKKVHTAKDGSEALRLLHSHPIDMVLSDWDMPVMNGLELLKAMRADDKLFSRPLVMITAEADRSRIEEAIACGVTSMMLKPYSLAQLTTRLEKAATWKPRKLKEEAFSLPCPEKPQSVSTPSNGEQPRPTILLVDDTPDNLLLLSQLLKDEFRVRLAVNGAKALEICTSDNPPDLVLLDIMMPDMDGFEVARRMRQHPNSETIPVIFVTALTSPDARAQGLDLGAVDFITKPIDPGVLKPRIRNFMRYVQLRKNLQADYDSMVDAAQLREDVEHITRHDMKGPLAGVIGLVQSMIDTEPVDRCQQVEHLRLIEEAALQVLNMINLSAELFKIEAGRFELHPVVVNVADILQRIVNTYQVTYSNKALHLVLVTNSTVHALGDPMLCYSVFQNLLKNACEAAPAGSTVSVRIDELTLLRIVIENKGVVPIQIRDRFFEKFVTYGKSSGTGLGTYSAKRLIEAQHGRIELAVVDASNTTAITVLLPKA